MSGTSSLVTEEYHRYLAVFCLLYQLSHTHYCFRYGVTPEMFPAMGESLIFAMKKLLGDKMNDHVTESYLEVFDALTKDMITAMKKKQAGKR